MRVVEALRVRHTVGSPCLHGSQPVEREWEVVFEDNTETGYFYAHSVPDRGKSDILVAVWIYQASDSTFGREIELRIVWNVDNTAAALEIDGRIEAVVSFLDRRACSRRGFPPTGLKWNTDHAWDDGMLQHFD